MNATNAEMIAAVEQWARATGGPACCDALGDGSSLSSFVSVLKVLGRADWLSTLQPVVTINPLDMLRQRGPRQRARKPRPPKED